MNIELPLSLQLCTAGDLAVGDEVLRSLDDLETVEVATASSSDGRTKLAFVDGSSDRVATSRRVLRVVLG